MAYRFAICSGVTPRLPCPIDRLTELLWGHPQVRSELSELFGLLDGRIDHLHTPLATHPDSPLQIHARYTRIEILAAFGLGSGAKIAAWQSGVYEAKAANAELLAFTLDKSSGGFSPTTRYLSTRRRTWPTRSRPPACPT